MTQANKVPSKPIVRISPNPSVFDLPLLVALEEKLFDEAGLDVRYAAQYGSHDPLEQDVRDRLPNVARHDRVLITGDDALVGVHRETLACSPIRAVSANPSSPVATASNHEQRRDG